MNLICSSACGQAGTLPVGGHRRGRPCRWHRVARARGVAPLLEFDGPSRGLPGHCPGGRRDQSPGPGLIEVKIPITARLVSGRKKT